MLITLRSLVQAHLVAPSSVLHIGAHVGQEADDYDELGFNPVWWVEADSSTCADLAHNLTGRSRHYVIEALCLNPPPRPVTFHIANNGQSSSVLELGTHATAHPEVVYVGERRIVSTTVDDLFRAGRIQHARFLNVDTQGSELMVMQGAEEYLEHVDAIYLEVNVEELYVGCALIREVDGWLGERGFRRIRTKITRWKWGDALFRRIGAPLSR